MRETGSERTASADSTCDESWPVLIVGGGPSGMAVASEVEGALLLEAQDHLGGRGGYWEMFFVGTEEQREAGFEDSVEQGAADWPVLTGSEPTEATLRYLEES